MPRFASHLKIVMLVVISLSGKSAIASGATPFIGRWQWDGPDTCAKSYDSDNVAFEISPERLTFYESSCAIRTVRQVKDGFYRFQIACTGEGLVEIKSIFLTMLHKSKVNEDLLLRIEPASGFVQAYRKCQ